MGRTTKANRDFRRREIRILKIEKEKLMKEDTNAPKIKKIPQRITIDIYQQRQQQKIEEAYRRRTKAMVWSYNAEQREIMKKFEEENESMLWKRFHEDLALTPSESKESKDDELKYVPTPIHLLKPPPRALPVVTAVERVSVEWYKPRGNDTESIDLHPSHEDLIL